jgi:two-component system LytT family sensor kinase
MEVNMDKISRREIGLFVFCLAAMSILYSTPRLFTQGFTWKFLVELGVDCFIMACACLPVWWLHFRIWAQKPLQWRFAMHIITAFLYYGIWVILYRGYNNAVGLPAMTGRQVFQNLGPNLLFYIQVFSSLHIDLFVREREKQFRKEQALLAWGHKAEVNALKAQIQPHFLFNTLNSISASVAPDQERTRVLISKLADTFRYALRASKLDVVPLYVELEFIRSYLLLEKERFGVRLSYSIDSDCTNVSLPPMLLQPLVENAIKHGIEPAVQGGEVCLRCYDVEGYVRVEVKNTGQRLLGTERDLFKGEGVGLVNTAMRIKSQYDEELKINILPEGGLSVGFRIPTAN